MKPLNSLKSKLTLAATAMVTAGALQAAPLVYEPFDYAVGGLNGKGGTSEVGLQGTWNANSTSLVVADSLYGSYATTGGSIGNLSGGSNRYGGTRALWADTSGNVLQNASLLDNGSTLWFSVVMGYDSGGNVTNSRLAIALADDQFNGGNFKYYLNGAGSNGLGVTLGRFSSAQASGVPSTANGYLIASQFRDSTNGTSGFGGNVFGTWTGTGTKLVGGENRLVVGSITWGATNDAADIMKIYNPDGDLNLGGAIGTFAVTVDQSNFDTITWVRGDKVVMDEIRIGATLADVTPTDITPPSLVSTIPTNGDGSADATPIEATFDDNVVAGAGDIRIYDATGAPVLFSTIAATDTSQVSISGNVVSFSPSTALVAGDTYYFEFDSDALEDEAGNAFAGFTGDATWKFTLDATPPAVDSLSPADDSMDVPGAIPLKINFDETILLGPGVVTIKNLTDVTSSTIAVTDGNQVFIDPADSSLLVIDPITPLDADKDYAIQIASGAVTDVSGNAYGGISDDTTWNFDTRAPYVLDVNNPLVPAGLGDGDTFQLLFVTDGKFRRDTGGNGRDDHGIYAWDDIVNASADASTLPTTSSTVVGELYWEAIVSVWDKSDNVPKIEAKDHAVVSAPVAMLNNTWIATGFNDMWDGNNIPAAILINENGTGINTAGGSGAGRLVWSGTLKSGLTHPSYPLGNGTQSASTGNSVDLNDDWIENTTAERRGPTTSLRFYALSEVITVADSGGGLTAFETWADSQGLVEGSNGQGDNADSGSLNNLGEFGLGGDPLDGNDDGSLLHAFSDDLVGGAEEEGILTILVRSGASFTDGAPAVSAAVDGIVYTVSADSTLPVGGSATVTGTAPVTTGLPAAPAGYEYASFYISGPEGYFQVTVAPE